MQNDGAAPSQHIAGGRGREYNHEIAQHLCLLFISWSKAIGLMPRGGEAKVTNQSPGRRKARHAWLTAPGTTSTSSCLKC